MTLQDFVKNMRRLRKAAGLTQQQLADIIGVRYATIGRYECGERELRAGDLDKILRALEVSVTLTPKGEDGKTPPAARFCPILKGDCLGAICALYDSESGKCGLRAGKAPQR